MDGPTHRREVSCRTGTAHTLGSSSCCWPSPLQSGSRCSRGQTLCSSDSPRDQVTYCHRGEARDLVPPVPDDGSLVSRGIGFCPGRSPNPFRLLIGTFRAPLARAPATRYPRGRERADRRAPVRKRGLRVSGSRQRVGLGPPPPFYTTLGRNNDL